MAEHQPLQPIFFRLLTLLAEDGYTQEQLFLSAEARQLGVSDISQIKLTDIPKLLQVIASLTNDPTLMMRLGERTDITSLGAFGFALMSCANLGEALKLLIRYHAITGPGPRFQLRPHNLGVILRIELELGNPIQKRLITELAFSELRAVGEILINQKITKGELHLNYPPPPDIPNYAVLFPLLVTFNQPYSQLVIPWDIVNTKVTTANPAGHVIFQQQCEDLLRSLNRIENFSAAIRRILINAAGEFPDINQVADKLHVSESTLRRRLGNESTNFRAICDEVRNLLACEYLSTTKLTVAEIASLLDYSEPVSFRRAFVRWNGMTPSDFRARS
ncbi:MAG: helix-turn-helix domain-containing protein [Porticoccaceae bacterium]|nr:helix-turn-helix domain-containing protein [Porticoccaceae bacterium]